VHCTASTNFKPIQIQYDSIFHFNHIILLFIYNVNCISFNETIDAVLPSGESICVYAAVSTANHCIYYTPFSRRSTKPEVHNVSQRRVRREPSHGDRQRCTHRKLMLFRRVVVLEICARTVEQTLDRQTRSSQYSAPLPGEGEGTGYQNIQPRFCDLQLRPSVVTTRKLYYRRDYRAMRRQK